MSDRFDFYVYVLFREDGQPFYVGKGHGQRINYHLSQIRRNRSGKNDHKDNIIKNMLDRNMDVPRVKLRSHLTEQQANEMEIAFIAAIGRHPNGPLVNLTDGGEGRVGAKLSEAHKTAFRRKGLHSVETRELMSKIAKARELHPSGWKISDEHKAICRAVNIGNRHMVGRRHSEETKTKIRQKAKEREMPRAVLEKAWAASRGRKAPPEERARQVQRQLMKQRSAVSCGVLSQSC